VRALAIAAIKRGATDHVRRAILECSGIDRSTLDHLTSPKFREPRANWPFTKFVRGAFVGPLDDLAAPDQQYPMLRWKAGIRDFVNVGGGRYSFTPEDNLTIVCGKGASFEAGSFEVWGPSNDPTEPFPEKMDSSPEGKG